MVSIQRLLILLFLLVALHVRAASATPWRAQGAGKQAVLVQPFMGQKALLLEKEG